MFVRKINIKNFKCFDDNFEGLEFNTPNGSLGSGLNIFVGENNCGKSTIFEAISFLRDGTKKSLNDIKNKKSLCKDFISVELMFSGDNIEGVIDDFSQENKKDIFKKYVYKNEANEKCLKLFRSSEKIKEIKLWDNSKSEFKNEAGIDAPVKKLFEINIVSLDLDPSDEASYGSSTTCGNLLKEIVKNFEGTDSYKNFSEIFNKTFNKKDSEFKNKLKEVEDSAEKIFIEQFGEAKLSFHFDELKIDSLLKNTKIKVDDGVLTNMEEKGDGMQRSITLALLQVYANQLIRHPEKDISKPFFLFIDEPELCLHPQAQIKLSRAISELSKNRQVFVATHSPYFFKNIAGDTKFFLFKKEVDNGVKILDVKNENWGNFPWSPSWGEINFYAYNLPTIEFHDELYGRLQEKTQNYKENDIENYFVANRITLCKKWTPEKDGKILQEKNVTLQTFIRNKIHHPENVTMQSSDYTLDDLKQSSEEMIVLLQALGV